MSSAEGQKKPLKAAGRYIGMSVLYEKLEGPENQGKYVPA